MKSYKIKYMKIKYTLKQTLKWYSSKWNTGKLLPPGKK